jgi:hypothetical protein
LWCIRSSANLTSVLPTGPFLLVMALSLVLLVLGHYRQPEKQVSSDGDRYLTLGRGAAVPYPFMWRWLVPAVCRTSVSRWRVCTDVHLFALPVLTSCYLGHWEVRASAAVFGGLLVCGFAGIWRNNIRRPVLVDPPALAWSLLSAVLDLNGHWEGALAVVVVAACMKETAPVYAACFCLDPLLLVGLVAPVVRRVFWKGGEDTHHSRALANPFGTARRAHAERLFDPTVMILPWGAGVLAVLATERSVVVILVLALSLAYGQLAVAGNTVRLYQWAAPAVALAAATVVPPGWEAALLTAHLFNPWAGDGR